MYTYIYIYIHVYITIEFPNYIVFSEHCNRSWKNMLLKRLESGQESFVEIYCTVGWFRSIPNILVIGDHHPKSTCKCKQKTKSVTTNPWSKVNMKCQNSIKSSRLTLIQHGLPETCHPLIPLKTPWVPEFCTNLPDFRLHGQPWWGEPDFKWRWQRTCRGFCVTTGAF